MRVLKTFSNIPIEEKRPCESARTLRTPIWSPWNDLTGGRFTKAYERDGKSKDWPCKVDHMQPVLLFNLDNVFMIKGLRSDLSRKLHYS